MGQQRLFPILPEMESHNGTAVEAEDRGDGNYVTFLQGTTRTEYEGYLAALESAGFQKLVDNGEGLAGAVFCATYTKDKWAVTVTHILKRQRTYLSLCFDKPLSEHLFSRKEPADVVCKDARTRLYMRELWWFGNSFVLQLKNGHFLISDGGQAADAVYLVEDLEALAPQGEKPVVEGWFISHGHMDHCGVFSELAGEPQLRERIFVEGIYFSIVGEGFYAKDEATRVDTAYMQLAARRLRRTDGGCPQLYRPHTGQQYYFSDITVDVVHTQEQLLKEAVTGDINDSSTLLMVNIEGQKLLLTGDADLGCMRTLMATYEREYLRMEIMTLMHHGFNTDNAFTDYCKVKTLLLTTRDILPVIQANENDYLKANVEEYFSWGDGAKVLTFPYTVGSYETLPREKWLHHNGEERKEPINVRRYWRSQRNKEIRTLRLTDHGFTKAAETLVSKIRQRIPAPFTEDGVMIELEIDPTIASDRRYTIRFVDPTGWKISAADEASLYSAIDVFLDTAEWSTQGFIAKERDD